MSNHSDFILHLADSTLILAQRNTEWCAHGPILEQDIAITNISLDLLGQARNFYQYAAELIGPSTGKPATEDSLAFMRNEREFKNLLITELPNGDWAQTILKQFFFSAYQSLLYEQLKNNPDLQIAAIAEKSLKEITYHLKWSSDWVIRLGDGTDESNKRINNAIEYLWEYTGEFFIPTDYENEAVLGFNMSSLKLPWLEKVKTIFEEATLRLPFFEGTQEKPIFMQTGGKKGVHTEHMGHLLAEMQSLQRTYPGAEW